MAVFCKFSQIYCIINIYIYIYIQKLYPYHISCVNAYLIQFLGVCIAFHNANLVWTFEVVIKPLCLDGIQSGRKQQSNNQCVDFCWAVHKIGGNTKCYQWLQSDELRDSSCSSVNVDLEITMTSR